MLRTISKIAGGIGTFAFAVMLTSMVTGCSKTKDPTTADITGANAPKLDPVAVRAKMAEAMGKMAAAGGSKRIDPNH